MLACPRPDRSRKGYSMTHAEIWAGIPAVYAKRIMEREKQLGECSGALQHAEKQLSMLRAALREIPDADLYIDPQHLLAIMGELP